MGWNENAFTRKFGITYPIIQAGMAGGITTPQLVAAVSNYGALGSLGAGYMNPDEMVDSIRSIKVLTEKPFNVNVFVPEMEVPEATEEYIGPMAEILKPYMDNMEIKEKPIFQDYKKNYENQIDCIIKEGVPICSFTFGIPSREVVRRLKDKNILLIGTATTVGEAVALEESGMDAIVVQGIEAGGHRGSFADTGGDGVIGTMALVPQVADEVEIPIIAAGGIMDGRGIHASMALGAQGVQMGTIFLATNESGTSEIYKEKLISSDGQNTTLTNIFSGRMARAIRNPFIEDMEKHHDKILPYPIQHDITSRLRKAAASKRNPDYMSLWAGQGVRYIKESVNVVQLMDELLRKMYIKKKQD